MLEPNSPIEFLTAEEAEVRAIETVVYLRRSLNDLNMLSLYELSKLYPDVDARALLPQDDEAYLLAYRRLVEACMLVLADNFAIVPAEGISG